MRTIRQSEKGGDRMIYSFRFLGMGFDRVLQWFSKWFYSNGEFRLLKVARVLTPLFLCFGFWGFGVFRVGNFEFY